MKKYAIFVNSILFSAAAFAAESNPAAYLFSYTDKNAKGRGGMGYAISEDGENWKFASWKGRTFLDGAYAYKGDMKLLDVFLHKDKKGNWRALWTTPNIKNHFGHSKSAGKDNPVNWLRKSYAQIEVNAQITNPIAYLAKNGDSVIEFKTDDGNFYRTSTKDFKKFSQAKKITEKEYQKNSDKLLKDASIEGELFKGTVNPLSSAELETVKQDGKWHKVAPWGKITESAKDDAIRFAGIESAKLKISADISKKKNITDMLMGVFFEDLNYAADGGLYAELIQNRDFEYSQKDVWNWNPMSFWEVKGNAKSEIKTDFPIHQNNKNHIALTVLEKGASLVNHGYGEIQNNAYLSGIVLKKGALYDFSAFVKGGINETLIRLSDSNGKTLAQGKINSASKDWKKENATLKANADCSNARLEIIPQEKGEICLDMVSLFPQDTFKGRRNGLRKDLAEAIADLKPQFVRFPGGCLVHALVGGEMNFYNWKDSIGNLEARKPIPNNWGYHQTRGLGYYEYFLFCEDLGAEPLPVIAAGVGCQNPGQRAIPMEEMPSYIQDILDLIEYANGDVSTKWGKIRAESGHPKPFNLKYVGIGNEDLISDQFEERFEMIFNAVKKKYPEIKIVGTSGPFAEGTDNREGWELAKKLKVDLVDDHYYVGPGWFIHNQNYYDNFDRNGPKVYLGEYASHIESRKNTVETALSCAIYLLNLERNGDVVQMASYAPLLSKKGHTQWTPDMIYFDNEKVNLSADYHIQKIFGQNSGQTYIPSKISLDCGAEGLKERVCASVVLDKNTNDAILKIVNLSPVKIEAELDIPFIKGERNAVKTVFAGKYDSENAVPEETKTKLSGTSKQSIMPYSLTVIRFKNK